VLPQALHELRKLNGAVLQLAERELGDRGPSKNLVSIKSAAELMRNNFDILEALSNIEGIKALRNDSTINLFDLVYKMKRVFEERANDRNMTIVVGGVRAIIWGSQKSFPIVPAVLIENAIKYGKRGSAIHANVEQRGRKAVLVVSNSAESPIDPETCFDRGVRFSSDVEGGGFGLFLAREVVACHGGHIRCDVSEETVQMTVELPLHTIIPMNV
jgi:signal transduction histidine kinase